MASTSFVDGVTLVVAAWANDVNSATYTILGDGTSYNGVLTLAGTANSTSITTGQAIIAGGVGVAKALWVGGLANIAGAVTHQSTTLLTGATTFSAAMTYGGVTLANSVTGTSSMMLSASPTTTGTLTAAAINASGLVAMAGAATVGTTLGVTTRINAGNNAQTTYPLEVGGVNGNGIRYRDSTNTVDVFAGAFNSRGIVGTITNHAVDLYANNAAFLSSTAAGAVTIPGTLKVGAVGLGGSTPQAGVGLYSAVAYLTGNNQYGILWDSTLSGTSSSQVFAGTVQAAAATTITNGYGLSIGSATLGAGAAITTNYGIKIENQTVGGTNYAIYTGTGAVRLGDTLSVSGTSTMAAINASGVIGVTTNNIYMQQKDTGGTMRNIFGLGNDNNVYIGDLPGFSGGVKLLANGITGFTLASGGAVSIPGRVTIGDGTGAADLDLNRSSTTSVENAIRWKTNGTDDFYLGSAASGANSDWELYNYGTSSVSLKVARSTGAVTIGGDLTAKAGTTVDFGRSGATWLKMDSNGMSFASQSPYPAVDNSLSFGITGQRWSAIWAANGTIQTSDERDKIVSDVPVPGLEFIRGVAPFFGKWVVGSNLPVYAEDGSLLTITPVPGKRTHAFISAQQVKAQMDKMGLNWGAYVYDEKHDTHAMRPDQLIPVLWKAIQELDADLQSYKNSHP